MNGSNTCVERVRAACFRKLRQPLITLLYAQGCRFLPSCAPEPDLGISELGPADRFSISVTAANMTVTDQIDKLGISKFGVRYRTKKPPRRCNLRTSTI